MIRRRATSIRPPVPAASALLAAVWLAVGAVAGGPASAGDLEVRVVDAPSGSPLAGAFVQIGDAPGSPFADNWGWTGADGRILFSDPGLQGPQTVTSALEDYARLTVFDAAQISILLPLQPEIPPAGISGVRAEISGSTPGIQVQNNDGNFDLGLVYPAVRLGEILASRALPIEVPSDTLQLPLIGEVVLPGNVTLPSQTEFFIYNFAKPDYHFFVPAGSVYDLVVLAGRLPISAISGAEIPLNEIAPREIGAERSVAVNGDIEVDITADLNLARTLTIGVSEAPAGTAVYTTSLGDIPVAGGSRTVFFDAKSALRDTLDSFLLAGLVPSGDLSDASPYIAGTYADPSSEAAFEAGRVDRTPLVPPAVRELDGFFLLPDLQQDGADFRWSDVSRPGVTPDPTWAVARFRLVSDGDSSVANRTVWEAWAEAGVRTLRLPDLASSAPGGLPDPGTTPEADRLVWEHWVADPSGGIEAILGDAFATLTRWSRRTVEISPPAVSVEEVGLGTVSGLGLSFRLAPNPGRDVRDVLWDRPPAAGQHVLWTVLDPSGRRVASGAFDARGALVDGRALTGIEHLPAGVYWVRLRTGLRTGTRPLVVVR